MDADNDTAVLQVLIVHLEVIREQKWNVKKMKKLEPNVQMILRNAFVKLVRLVEVERSSKISCFKVVAMLSCL